MVLMIDNYDSFTYNVVRYLRELGAEVVVRRNDAVSVAEVLAMAPSHLVISPGPGTPSAAGISVPLIQACGGRLPILGVCLGHQCIAEAFGARVRGAERIVHGKTSLISHSNQGIFHGLPSTFVVARYHSLIVDEPSLPDCLEVLARTSSAEAEIMAIRHRVHDITGVQFHPEAILTEHGHALLQNFLFPETARAAVGAFTAGLTP